MCILAPSVKALQYLLNICCDYAEAHDITYNTNKSVCMHIKCTMFKMRVAPSVYLGGNIMLYVCKYKYLGCIITDTLRDDDDIKRTIRGIYARSNMRMRKFYNCSSHVNKFVFKTYCTTFTAHSYAGHIPMNLYVK